MNPSIRSLSIAVALTTGLATFAHAGGSTARVDGPFKDGSYTVQTMRCGEAAFLNVTATAEGVVNGKRASLPIKLAQTKEKGVYQFSRTWPAGGTWVVRVVPVGNDRAVTLATLASDGSVAGHEFLWKSDGRHECDQKLAANTK